jgi:molybdopterin synthase sulfur carrier subunit
MKLRVRYFASIREQLGAEEIVELDAAQPQAGSTTVGGLRDLLIARGGAHAAALARGRALRMAVDQVMAGEATALHDQAEVAFFPPVTGG